MADGGLPPVAANLSALGVSNLDRYRTQNDWGLDSVYQAGHNDLTVGGHNYLLMPSDDGFSLYDPANTNAGSQLYNSDGSYRKFYSNPDTTPFATWLATSIVGVAGFAVGASEFLPGAGAGAATGGAATVTSNAADSFVFNAAADSQAANLAIGPDALSGYTAGSFSPAVADFSAAGAAPLASGAVPGATPSAFPTLQQIGQGLGIASTVGKLVGGSGAPSSTGRPGYTILPGSFAPDNGTSPAGGPTWYGTPGAAIPGQQLLSSNGGALGSSTFLIGAAIVVAAVLLAH